MTGFGRARPSSLFTAVAAVAALVAFLLTSAPDSLNLLSESQRTFMGELGWVGESNATISHVAGPSHVDQGSLSVTATSPSGSVRVASTPTTDGAVAAGAVLDGSVRVRPRAGSVAARCSVSFFDEQGRLIGDEQGTRVRAEAPDWTGLDCRGTAPDGTVSVSLAVAMDDFTKKGVVLLDDAWLTVSSAAPDPEPSPDPDPSPPLEPSPDPDPSPPLEPSPDPDPSSSPSPDPDPSPDPEPSPEPDPEPSLEPDPEPSPDPEPDTEPSPHPDGDNLLSTAQQTMVGPGGWTPQGNTTVALVSSPSVDGRGGLRVRVDETGPWPDATGTARAGTDPVASVTPGDSLEGHLAVTAQEGSSAMARCEIRWYDEAGSIIGTAFGGLRSVSSGWTPLSCAATAPSGVAATALRVYFAGADYGEVFVVDDAWLVPTGASTDDGGDDGTVVDEGTDDDDDTTVVPDPDPDPEAPTTWTDAWATSDLATIRAWYRSNTGIAAAGLTDGDLQRSGSIITSRDGQVISGMLVSGSIIVRHDDVTIRNTKVVNDGGSIAIDVSWADRDRVKSFTVENVSLIGTGGAAAYKQALGATYATGTGVEASRVHINGFGGGFRLSAHGSDSVDLSMVENIRTHPGSHNTGTSFRGGTGKSLTRSWIEGSTSSALSMYPDASPVKDLHVAQNLFDGGTYSINGGDNKTYGGQTTADFRNNLFTRDHLYGPIGLFDRSLPGRTWVGNAYLDGTPIP